MGSAGLPVYRSMVTGGQCGFACQIRGLPVGSVGLSVYRSMVTGGQCGFAWQICGLPVGSVGLSVYRSVAYRWAVWVCLCTDPWLTDGQCGFACDADLPLLDHWLSVLVADVDWHMPRGEALLIMAAWEVEGQQGPVHVLWDTEVTYRGDTVRQRGGRALYTSCGTQR